MRHFLAFLIALTTLLGATMHADNMLAHHQTVLILLGPPGSGKGTQSTQLSKELGIPHISTGDLFRDNIKSATSLGKKAKSYIDAGQLVPDAVVLEMLFDRISQPDSGKGFLLDGFPRTIPQAEAFDLYIEKTEARIIVFNLDVPDEVIVQRAAGRLTCAKCGQVHNKALSLNASAGHCDKCDGDLVQRSDDQPEVVKERLRVYHAQTEPLIKYYEQKGVLTTFDGTKPPQVVFGALKAQLQNMAVDPLNNAASH